MVVWGRPRPPLRRDDDASAAARCGRGPSFEMRSETYRRRCCLFQLKVARKSMTIETTRNVVVMATHNEFDYALMGHVTTL